MVIKINEERYVLWWAVDSTGHELDILVQKNKSKKAAKCFFCKLLGRYPAPRVAVTDKLPSDKKPIKQMCPKTEPRCHKRLNNRVENAHQPTRRKEKGLIKFKSPKALQRTVSIIGKTRNIFAIAIGRYIQSADEQRKAFRKAKTIWSRAVTAKLKCPF